MREIKFRAWDGERMVPVAQIDFRYPKPLLLDNDKPNYANKRTGQWELMQFTGLNDKNGKEIYEGDIVRIQSQLTERITSDEIVWARDGFKTKRGGQIPREARMEVIGNIYESTQLLEH